MEDISLHILDIAENAISANATFIGISMVEETVKDLFTVKIEDNGKGMTAEFVQKILDPFCTTRTTRKVGLGLSFLAQSARETGGDIVVHSVLNKGTVVTADFRPSHIDMRPLGNIADTITTLIAGNPRVDLLLHCAHEGRSYRLDTREIRAALEEVPINSSEVLSAIRNDLLEALQGFFDLRPRLKSLKETGNVPL
jgi:hypothetical protein